MIQAVQNGEDWSKKVESKESVDECARELKMKQPKETSKAT